MQPQPQIDLTHLGNQTTHMLQSFLEQHTSQAEALTPIMQGFMELSQSMWQNPERLMQMQMDLYQSTLHLWANMADRAMGKEVENTIEPQRGDRRFASEQWQEHIVFDFIKQSYLLISKWMMDSVTDESLSEDAQRKVSFYTRQYVDAISPNNFPLTNPDILQATFESSGQNLIDGLKNLLDDMNRGRIAMSENDHFVIGENLATTKGDVVYRNRLIELIQYSPTTPKVNARPVLISPPWINRFYVMDLQEKNSFVKFALDQGLQVFMISWKNPDESYKDVSFEDYMKEGILEAIDHTLQITGQKDLNMVGYCIGGTLLSATLAAMAKKKDTRVNSATFITTLMDFEDCGEIRVFLDDQQVSSLEKKMFDRGYLEGSEMAASFSMLNSNDLIWSFIINNYLLGKAPMPFDMLHWNTDSTRMPAAMHSYYLRNMYLENNLAKKNKLTLLGEKIDLSEINIPIYMISGTTDHITPWEGCYKPLPTMKSKDITFTLGKAGHVGGMVNPPTKAGKPIKKKFWSGQVNGEKDPQKWLKAQKEEADSWWPHWTAWAKKQGGEEIDAPKQTGNAKHKPLEAAPGSYVKQQY